VSREGAFVLQNLLLLGVVAVVLWGTVLPLVSGMLGQERVVGAAYYERAAGPLFVAILALMAAGPLLPWRHAGSPLLRALRWPAGVALAVFGALLLATTCLVEYGRGGLKVRAAGSWSRAAAQIVRKRRRYGAYLAHLGLVVLVAGVAASHFWQVEKDVSLMPGDHVSMAGYTLTYVGAESRQLADHTELVGAIRLGDQVLEPARATYAGLGGQSLTHVAISSSPITDVYVVLTGVASDGSASFRIFINPLVSWIWAGGAIIILGVLLGNLGERRVAIEPVAERKRTAVPA
jgi:cytochrome c-type biogenesis protein CcmF